MGRSEPSSCCYCGSTSLASSCCSAPSSIRKSNTPLRTAKPRARRLLANDDTGCSALDTLRSASRRAKPAHHSGGPMGLRDKYAHAIQTAKDLRMQGSADERDNKLYFHGTVPTEAEVNKIWDAIKTVPDWRNDIVGDIKATGVPSAAAAGATGGSYTVRPGHTLSKIAKEKLGDPNAYMEIFNANKDQLTDPNKIKAGQVLKIPMAAR